LRGAMSQYGVNEVPTIGNDDFSNAA